MFHRRQGFLPVTVSVYIWMALTVPPSFAECDLEAPELTGFSLDPVAVDVTLASVEVACEMTFTDAPGGVEEATCVLTPTVFFLQQKVCVAEQPSVGDRFNGTFICSVTIPRYSFPGTWDASLLSVDTVGNERALSAAELQSAGFPTSVFVTSSQDLMPPTLDGFDFDPQTVDVSAAARDVTCTMQLQDPLAGVAQASCGFFAPGFTQGQTCFAFEPISGSRQDGTFACTISIPRYADAATWEAFVIARDTVDNQLGADAATLQSLGFPAELTVVSAPEDLLSPQLLSFDFSPSTIDVSSQPKLVHCELEVSDTPAGVFGTGCTFDSPSGLINHSCFSFAPSSGTPQAGTFGCAVLIPRYSEQGIWKATVGLFDNAANTPLVLDAPTLAIRGLPTDLSVTCEGAEEPYILFETLESLIWDPIAGALRYNVYRGNLAALVDDDSNGQPDGGYGTCENGADPDLTDTAFLDPDVPRPMAGLTYLVSYLSDTGEVGLGTNSAGTLRVVSPCP